MHTPITHIAEPGPVDVWNPVTGQFDNFDGVCMRCQRFCGLHHHRLWVYWHRWRLRKRLRPIRKGMDAAAHALWIQRFEERT